MSLQEYSRAPRPRAWRAGLRKRRTRPLDMSVDAPVGRIQGSVAEVGPTRRREGGSVCRVLAATRPSRTVASQSLILPLIRVRSKAELAVRAEANELESLAVGFAIDEHEIRPNMAVTKVFPPAGERMIVKTRATARRRPAWRSLRRAGRPTFCRERRPSHACNPACIGRQL